MSKARSAVEQPRLIKHRTPYLQPYLQAYLHFTAYTVTSRSLLKGTCVQTTGSPVHLIDPYVVSVKPLSFYNTLTFLGDISLVPKDAAAITAEYSVFLEDAYSSLDATIRIRRMHCCSAAVPSCTTTGESVDNN